MTTGRKGEYSTPFGVTEFTHTARSVVERKMHSRSAVIFCLSPSGLFTRPSSPARRATGFEPACRTRCVDPD